MAVISWSGVYKISKLLSPTMASKLGISASFKLSQTCSPTKKMRESEWFTKWWMFPGLNSCKMGTTTAP